MAVNAEYALKHGQAWDEADKKGETFFLSKGGKIISQTAEESERWAKKSSVLVEKFINATSPRGIEGKAVVDFIHARMQQHQPDTHKQE